MISRIVVMHYRRFRNRLDIELNEDLNILVGDNEAGKSTLLECVNLVLAYKINGRHPQGELTPYLFNKEVVSAYVDAVNENPKAPLPKILIELYFKDLPDLADLKGTMNSRKEDVPGVKVLIRFNESFRAAYDDFCVKNHSKISTVPIEYYEVVRYTFGDDSQQVGFRNMPVVSSLLDASSVRLQSGTDAYLRSVINEVLDDQQKAELSLTFRTFKEKFFNAPSIREINTELKKRKGDISEKEVEVSVDATQRHGWDSHLIPYLDRIPFQFVGMGEQNSLKLLLTLSKEVDSSQVVLIEELENHLSFSSMNRLLNNIKGRCKGKQLIITTHSTYVLNKLGIDRLMMIGQNGAVMRLSDLNPDTRAYFEKLPGYDTLRLVLAKESILVEGPSDELYVQRAYKDMYGHLPIEDGVDVICVRGLSFKRFLDIALILDIKTTVVTDNDGDYKRKVEKKYEDYIGKGKIRICASTNDGLRTVEPQIVGVNDLKLLNQSLGSTFTTKNELETYMTDSANKTDCALAIFSSSYAITYPDYVLQAITREE